MDFLFIHPYLIDGFTHFEEIIPAKKIQKRGFGGGGGSRSIQTSGACGMYWLIFGLIFCTVTFISLISDDERPTTTNKGTTPS